MLVKFKGSNLNYAYCHPNSLDLAVQSKWARLPDLIAGYPYPCARGSNANYFGARMQGEAKDSGGTIYETQIVDGRPVVYVRKDMVWYNYDHTEVVDADVAIGGGPMLVVDGVIGDIERRIVAGQFSGLRQSNKCQRCAIGYVDGLLLHVVADNLTLYELAEWFVERKCEWAMNFDGGGSVGLIENGKLTMGSKWRSLPSALVIREIERGVAEVGPLFMQDFIPKTRFNRPNKAMTPRYICVHDSGNAKPTADAVNHGKWLKSFAPAYSKEGKITNKLSYHYSVDDHCIVQHLPWNERGYHAGDGAGAGNSSSIGIEICENADGDRAKAEENAISLIVDLLRETGLRPDAVVPHKFFTGKNCPRVILARHDGWNDFMARVRGKFAE